MAEHAGAAQQRCAPDLSCSSTGLRSSAHVARRRWPVARALHTQRLLTAHLTLPCPHPSCCCCCLCCCHQVRENKTRLANYETQDMGKPIDEAEWDLVSSGETGDAGQHSGT